MSDIKLYFKYISISIRSQMQYKASFVMMTIGHFVITFIEFIGVYLLFQRFGSIKGWTLSEVALFYGVINISFALAESWARGFDIFSYQVARGEFDRILLRPRGLALQILGMDFQLMRIGRLMQGLVVLLWSISTLSITFNLPKVLLLLFSIVSGVCLFSGLFIIQATISFWSIQSLEIINSFTYGGVQTAQYPLNIYKKWFQKVFIFILPFAMINYYPALILLDRTELTSVSWLGWISPIVGFIFYLITLQVFKFGVKYYCSTGS